MKIIIKKSKKDKYILDNQSGISKNTDLKNYKAAKRKINFYTESLPFVLENRFKQDLLDLINEKNKSQAVFSDIRENLSYIEDGLAESESNYPRSWIPFLELSILMCYYCIENNIDLNDIINYQYLTYKETDYNTEKLKAELRKMIEDI